MKSYQKVVVAIARHGGHFGQNVVLIKGVRGGAKVDSRTTFERWGCETKWRRGGKGRGGKLKKCPGRDKDRESNDKPPKRCKKGASRRDNSRICTEYSCYTGWRQIRRKAQHQRYCSEAGVQVW